MHAHRIVIQLYNNGQQRYFNLNKYWIKSFQALIIKEEFSQPLESDLRLKKKIFPSPFQADKYV